MWSLDWQLSMGGRRWESGDEGQKSQFHSLFFTQAAVIAVIIIMSEKKNAFERSIIYLHYNCLLSVHVFVHEAIHHTELNIYFSS